MSLIRIVKLALVSAIYVVLTVVIAPLSYGSIQFRFAEILVLLPFFRKDYIYSLIIGCFIANIFSPIFLFDIFFGVFHTALSVYLISREKRLWRACLYPIILMPIIGLELSLAYQLPFILTSLTCMLGEAVVIFGIAYPLFSLLRKNIGFMQLIDANQNRRD